MTRSRGLLAGLRSLAALGLSMRRERNEDPIRPDFADERVPYIHQVIIIDGYDTPEQIPPPIARNAQAARSVYPAARYRLWNGHQLRSFLAERFDREVLAAFDTLAPYSYKCDLARFCLLYELGGIYVDLGVRLMAPWTIPAGCGVAAFRDVPFLTTSWTAMQTGLLWSLPRQREFALAIDLIVGNLRACYYGSGPLHPTGPALLGKAMLAAMADRGWDGQDPQYIGMCRALTPESETLNLSYVSPENSLIALRTKLVPGDLSHLGIAQGNNYNQLWRTRGAYGERMWRWQVADPGETPPGAEPAGPFRRLRLDPPCIMLEGAYEALLSLGDAPLAAGAIIRVRSRRGGDGAVDEEQAVGTAATERPVPIAFVVDREEDELDCWIDVPAGHVVGPVSVTVREAPVRRWAFDDPRIRPSLGIFTERGIRIPGSARGLVSFGPYATLFRGRYLLEVAFDDITPSSAKLEVEVCADLGDRPIGFVAVPASELARSGMISLTFVCETDARNVEFRVHAHRRARALVTRFTLRRAQ